MCIVIDTNTIAALFDPKNAEHADFVPVFEWILHGKGKLVYGGSTYKDELQKMPKYIRFFAELNKQRKTVQARTEDVDREEARIKEAEPSPDFDDAHILAIHDVSGCLLLCSKDGRADRFLKKRKLYTRGAPPKIYRRAKYHKALLCDDNIARCCQPDVVLAKTQKDALAGLTDR